MDVSSDCGFGRRLRAERERRKITLQSIAENTKISLSLLEGLERDDVSRWPSGIFRRAFVRAYAQSVGLDPDQTAREFLEHFPDPADLIDPTTAVATLAGATLRNGSSGTSALRIGTSRTEASRADAPGIDALRTEAPRTAAPRPDASRPDALRTDALRTGAPHPEAVRTSARRTALRTNALRALAPALVRVRIANAGAAFMRGRLVPEVPRRWAAAIWDAGVLIAVATLLFIAVREFWMPFALITLGYYAGSIVLLGNTPGVSLFAEEKRREL